jgi:hypothetical protein
MGWCGRQAVCLYVGRMNCVPMGVCNTAAGHFMAVVCGGVVLEGMRVLVKSERVRVKSQSQSQSRDRSGGGLRGDIYGFFILGALLLGTGRGPVRCPAIE